jgi:hypothetical protein
MLLLTLLPELEPEFGKGHSVQRAGLKVEDPLLRKYSIAVGSGDDTSKAFAKWFFGGANTKDVQRALNGVLRAKQVSTRTVYAEKNHKDATFDYLTAAIDDGLPIILAWDSDDFGLHAVLVVGYRRMQLRWLIVNDPSDGQIEIAWESLSKATRGRFEVVRVDADKHSGPRPDKVILLKGDESPKVQRWWHKDGVPAYFDTDELFRLGASKGYMGDDVDQDESDS